jgi:membrane-bound lytic murein transglycosylase D
MTKRYLFFASGFAAAIILFLISGTSSVLNESNDNDNFPQGYKIIAPKIPDEMSFCGERVPLENFEVFERIDRELIVNTYFHSHTILALKRANRWFPVIEPILAQNNIPDDFKYLMVAESGIYNAISSAGATGYWQFMEGTAIKYGLEVSSEVDERYHVEKSTIAACKYLNEAYSKFGSWTIAAASYNMGIPGIEKQIQRQKTRNYYNLVINEETSRYIARIIATKEIMNYPEKYGFEIKEEDLYQPLLFNEEFINGSIADLTDYAISKGINYKILKLYNPWLRDNTLKNPGNKTYAIKIPEMGSIKVIEELY